MAKQTKLEKAQDALAAARKRLAGFRENKTNGLIARGLGAAGTIAGTAGKLDGVINMIPGGHFGHSDYTKAPSLFSYKRFLAAAGATAASVYFLDGIEGDVASPVLASLAGRAIAQHNATFYKKTAARSPEELAKDIGAAEAAKVAAANGYPQV